MTKQIVERELLECWLKTLEFIEGCNGVAVLDPIDRKELLEGVRAALESESTVQGPSRWTPRELKAAKERADAYAKEMWFTAPVLPTTETRVVTMDEMYGDGNNPPLAASQDKWRAMAYAPLDGTKVMLLIRHKTWWTAHKCDPASAPIWEAECEGHWIDHNGGGWTWAGMAGTPIGWRERNGAPQ